MIKVITKISSALVLVCLATELLLRFFIISPTNTQADDELGWRYIPHTKILQSSEGYTRIKMDANGLNNDDRKSSINEPKLIVLGDSYTEALQINRAKNFVTLAESELGCMELYNAGRAGSTFLHYPILLERLEQQFDIDQALIIAGPGDLSDMLNAKYTIELTGGEISSVTLKTKQRSKLRQKLDAVIFERSALATYLKARLKALKENKNKSSRVQQKTQSIESMARATGTVKHLLNSIKTNAQLTILFLPSYQYSADRRIELNSDSNLAAGFFRSIAEDLQINFIEASGLDEFYIKHGIPPYGFENKSVTNGHLNLHGHRIIANNIVAAYQQQCDSEQNSNVKGTL